MQRLEDNEDRHVGVPLHLYPGVQKTPAECMLYEWSRHKKEIWTLLGKKPLTEVGFRCKEFEAWGSTHTSELGKLADSWGYAGHSAPGLSVDYYSLDWKPWKIAMAITFNNITRGYPLSDVKAKMKSGMFDDATIKGTYAHLLSHFAVNFSASNLDPAIYGEIRQQTNAIPYSEHRFALTPLGDIKFDAAIAAPMELVGGMWKPEPIQEYVLGRADWYLFLPEEMTPTRLEYLAMTDITAMSGFYGLMVYMDYLKRKEKNPNLPPFETTQQTHDNYVLFGEFFKKLKAKELATGVRYAKFRRNPLYKDLLDVAEFELPSPTLSVLERILLADDPLLALQSLTHSDLAKMFAQDLHDALKRFYAVDPNAPRFTASASGYNRYQYHYMKALGIDVSDLPHVDLAFPPDQETFEFTETLSTPTRYGEHVYNGET